jgi:hypothetical protein
LYFCEGMEFNPRNAMVLFHTFCLSLFIDITGLFWRCDTSNTRSSNRNSQTNQRRRASLVYPLSIHTLSHPTLITKRWMSLTTCRSLTIRIGIPRNRRMRTKIEFRTNLECPPTICCTSLHSILITPPRFSGSTKWRGETLDTGALDGDRSTCFVLSAGGVYPFIVDAVLGARLITAGDAS